MEIDIQDLAALCLIVLLFVWILAAPWRRKKEDKAHWENWNKALDLSKSEFGCRMFRIVSIHQHASTGTKAYAIFEDSSHAEAVWIPDLWPAKGEYIVCRGDYGYGAHHDEKVFYVKQVLLSLDKHVHKGWKRQEKRRRKVEIMSTSR